MTTLIGIVVLIAGLVCWIGQSLSFLSPRMAEKLGLSEPENEIDETLYVVETRAQGLVDMLLTWTLPLSGLLMILEHKLWPVLALTGGGIYLYFSGLIILQRVFLKQRGKKVGRPSAERSAYIFGFIWMLCALSMIVLAVDDLGLWLSK